MLSVCAFQKGERVKVVRCVHKGVKAYRKLPPLTSHAVAQCPAISGFQSKPAGGVPPCDSLKKMPKRWRPGIFAIINAIACGANVSNLAFNTTAAAETLAEAINTTTGIQHFLLTSVERVAGRTYVYVQVFRQG